MEIIARGREAEILDAGRGLVLRRYFDCRDTAAEVALMQHVAAHEFPCPRQATAVTGGMLMERLTGPTLIEAAASGAVTTEQMADVLIDLQRRLHTVPVPADAVGANPTDTIAHYDLHPANVIMTADGPVLIDWAAARPGPADLDVAMTAMILAEVCVAGVQADSGSVTKVTIAPSLVRGLLTVYLARIGIDPRPRLELARRLRAASLPPMIAGPLTDAAAALVRSLCTSPEGPSIG